MKTRQSTLWRGGPAWAIRLVFFGQIVLIVGAWAFLLIDARASVDRLITQASMDTRSVLMAGSIVGDMALRSATAGIMILTLSSMLTYFIVQRRQDRLEQINDRLEAEIEARIGHSLAVRHSLIFGLAKLADSRDSDTGRHLERICAYSVILAEALEGTFTEINRLWIENLRVAASLHDIGKVGIPDSVLLKPGALSPTEREQIQRHPMIGADTLIAVRQMLGRDDLIEMSLQICLSHHERWDGTGYPYALSADQIPLSARIVALADLYDALTSERVYKDSMSHNQAVAIVEESSGTHFDPTIVKAFMRVRNRFDDMRRQLMRGESGPFPVRKAA
jgi:putative two-component system response regulator